MYHFKAFGMLSEAASMLTVKSRTAAYMTGLLAIVLPYCSPTTTTTAMRSLTLLASFAMILGRADSKGKHNPSRPYRPKGFEVFEFECGGNHIVTAPVNFTYQSQAHYIIPEELNAVVLNQTCSPANPLYDLPGWNWTYPWTGTWRNQDASVYVIIPCKQLSEYTRGRCCWHSAVSATKKNAQSNAHPGTPGSWQIDACFPGGGWP